MADEKAEGPVYEIREGRATDVSAISRLVELSLRDFTPESAIEMDQASVLLAVMDWFQNGQVWIVADRKRAIGGLAMKPAPWWFDQKSGAWHESWSFVLPEHRCDLVYEMMMERMQAVGPVLVADIFGDAIREEFIQGRAQVVGRIYKVEA